MGKKPEAPVIWVGRGVNQDDSSSYQMSYSKMELYHGIWFGDEDESMFISSEHIELKPGQQKCYRLVEVSCKS